MNYLYMYYLMANYPQLLYQVLVIESQIGFLFTNELGNGFLPGIGEYSSPTSYDVAHQNRIYIGTSVKLEIN